MRYLQGTASLGLVYKKESDVSKFRVIGFTDLDWAGDSDQRHSIAAYTIMAALAPVSWSCKRLQTICLSSTKAEYAACTEAAKELLSHRKFQEGLGLQLSGPTDLFCDSQLAIALSQNPIYDARTKHIEIKHHFIQQLVAEKEITLRYVATEENLADFLTKALPAPTHNCLTASLGLMDLTRDRRQADMQKIHKQSDHEIEDELDSAAI